ncbi:glycosyltransferase [Streptomyces alkaliphilus]|uniref:Glycosyltransferase n=1 Tax=Streptomyces alkaliphilus TaxID=1472722 RepID=A0A7W3T9Y1_9ACTN|nr:glycosyltransferase [Streptomyces alkaliphilus]MBB0242837.1 glycosyltransferase [Streptomyces alkaliphilus]
MTDVSVIIGAYNAMPYLIRSVQSVLDQTIGSDRIELIAVNDGSTDDTGDELDRFAKAHPSTVRVIHQENSGGPAKPRNVGLSLATGRYVFFLDADDYLGPEALDRMVTMADENNTDVVLGKMVGVGGRGAPKSMFRQDQPKTDVFSSRAYWTLNPMKLFRRELIEQHNLRFPPELRLGQDQVFTAGAYLHASGISILSSYDCVYWVTRDDGGNNTVSTGGAAHRVRIMATMLPLVGEAVPPGERRDHLMDRHMTQEFHHALLHIRMEPDIEARARYLDQLREIVSTWHSSSLMSRVPAAVRVREHLLRVGRYESLLTFQEWLDEHLDRIGRSRESGWLSTLPNRVLVEKEKFYGEYPGFREDSSLPDDLFEVTRELPRAPRATAMIVKGTEVGITGSASVVPSPRIPNPCTPPDLRGTVFTEASVSRGGALLIRASLPVGLPPGPLRLRATSADGAVFEAVGHTGEDGRSLSALLRLRETGEWKLALRHETVKHFTEIPVKTAFTPSPTRWHERGRLRYAKFRVSTSSLIIRVGNVSPIKAVARRIGMGRTPHAP